MFLKVKTWFQNRRMKHKKVNKKSVNSTTGKTSSLINYDQISSSSVKAGAGTNDCHHQHVSRKGNYEMSENSRDTASRSSRSSRSSRNNSLDSNYDGGEDDDVDEDEEEPDQDQDHDGDENTSESNRSLLLPIGKSKYADLECNVNSSSPRQPDDELNVASDVKAIQKHHLKLKPTELGANNEIPFGASNFEHMNSFFNFQSLPSAQQFKLLSQFYTDLRSGMVGNTLPSGSISTGTVGASDPGLAEFYKHHHLHLQQSMFSKQPTPTDVIPDL